MSPTTTPTFVGFPYISFVSTCLHIFGTFSWPIFNHYRMNKVSIYNYHLLCPAKAINTLLISITNCGESLRNGMFTICQIGFIGTVIQWWSLMQWYNMKWILPYYGHSSAVIHVILPRPGSQPQKVSVVLHMSRQTLPPFIVFKPFPFYIHISIFFCQFCVHFAFTFVGIGYHFALEYIQTG